MDYGEEKKSRFNAGVALAERIDALQRTINSARFNPLQINPDTQTYNYEIIIECNHALVNEAWDKLNKDEREIALRLRNVLKAFNKAYPVILISNSGEMQINKKIMRRWLSF